MIHDVVTAEYIGDYRIKLIFDDGKEGEIDFSTYCDLGGVFEKFRDLNFFRDFRVDPDFGVLRWGDDVDIAPETLYAKATGEPLPAWMVAERTGEYGKS